MLALSDEDVTTLRRAALVHDFGTTGVPNSIWDKPGALTRSEFDRVELHPMLTEQMLRRSPALAILNPCACAHHEKADGSGYHKRLAAPGVEPGASVLAAVDVYVGLTAERADRPPFSGEDAAKELHKLASEGVLDSRATEAVLTAAGHGGEKGLRSLKTQHPGGLASREVDVLRLAARGPGDAVHRGPAEHFAEDRRSPHPAHLYQDRCIHAGGRGALGHAARRMSGGIRAQSRTRSA